MINKDIIHEFNNIFPKDILNELSVPIDTFSLYLERLSIDPFVFYETWSNPNRQSLINKYWKNNPKLDWKWSLSFPLFTVLEKYVNSIVNPRIIGFSGLPGSGKTTLGYWIDNVARELCMDIKVISLDDFYLPGKEMDIAMSGNPWNVPRGFPGSHSIDLLNKSIDTYLETGILNCPSYDKSLRDGKGDRSGWCLSKPKILILEGWFVGCNPISDLVDIDNISEEKFDLCLSPKEKDFRISIQESLFLYSDIWKKFDKIWHLKSSRFTNTILWKMQQEQEMIRQKGTGLKDKRLTDFIRMIQTSIPQESLTSINSDTTIVINQDRRINNLYTNTYLF